MGPSSRWVVRVKWVYIASLSRTVRTAVRHDRTLRTFASKLFHVTLVCLLGGTVAFGMYTLCLAQFPTLVALGNWPAFLLDFEEGPVGVTA